MITAVDLFCGAGGTSTGLYQACKSIGVPVDLTAINHWPRAIETHSLNHPDAKHICARIESLRPEEVIPGGHLDILAASPECTHHSVARGGKPVSDQLRSSAWLILRWLETLKVDNILIENVREFRDWGPVGANGKPLKSKKGQTYQAWLNAIRSFGYTVEDRLLNAADYGDPTSRQRLFILAKKGKKPITWPLPTHGAPGNLHGLKPHRAAREIIDFSIESKSIFNRKKPLAPATLARIAAGLKKFGGKNAKPFLVMMYGTNDARDIDRPMPTITAGGSHIALCEPFIVIEKGKSKVRSTEEPLPTITTNPHLYLCEPFLLGQQSCSAPRDVGQPVPTISTKGAIGLVEPFLVTITHKGNDGNRTHSINKPVPTITGAHNGEMALIEPFLVKYHGNHKGKNDGEKRVHTGYAENAAARNIQPAREDATGLRKIYAAGALDEYCGQEPGSVSPV